jgi:hypothetical protein
MIIFLIGFISGALAMLLYCHLHYNPLIDDLLKKNREMKERSANAEDRLKPAATSARNAETNR